MKGIRREHEGAGGESRLEGQGGIKEELMALLLNIIV